MKRIPPLWQRRSPRCAVASTRQKNRSDRNFYEGYSKMLCRSRMVTQHLGVVQANFMAVQPNLCHSPQVAASGGKELGIFVGLVKAARACESARLSAFPKLQPVVAMLWLGQFS